MEEDTNRMGRKIRRWKKRKRVEGGEGGAGFQSFLKGIHLKACHPKIGSPSGL